MTKDQLYKIQEFITRQDPDAMQTLNFLCSGNYEAFFNSLTSDFKYSSVVEKVKIISAWTEVILQYPDSRNFLSSMTTLYPGMGQALFTTSKAILPKNITSLKEFCFSLSDKIQNLNLFNSAVVDKVEASCCLSMSQLTSVILPRALLKIPLLMFSGCTELTTVWIPKTVSQIDFGAFQDCKKLRVINYNGDKKEWQDNHTKRNAGIFLNTDFSTNEEKIIHCRDGDLRTEAEKWIS